MNAEIGKINNKQIIVQNVLLTTGGKIINTVLHVFKIFRVTIIIGHTVYTSDNGVGHILCILQ